MKIDPVIRMRDLPEYTGLGRSTIYHLRRYEGFPEPMELGAGYVGWRQSTIDAWMAQRAKDAAATKRARRRTAGE